MNPEARQTADTRASVFVTYRLITLRLLVLVRKYEGVATGKLCTRFSILLDAGIDNDNVTTSVDWQNNWWLGGSLHYINNAAGWKRLRR